MNDFKNGEVYIAFVNFVEDLHNKENARGKVRPVVIFEVPEDNKLYACKVSSKVDKPIKKRYGYVLQDWKEAGIKSPSVVACDSENIREIDPTSIKKYVGQLTERDIRGMLVKHIKVRAMEHEMEQSLER